MHGRTKHLEIRHHFIRDLVQQGVVQVIFCNTESLLADILTKALAAGRFEQLRSVLNVVSFESQEGAEVEGDSAVEQVGGEATASASLVEAQDQEEFSKDKEFGQMAKWQAIKLLI